MTNRLTRPIAELAETLPQAWRAVLQQPDTQAALARVGTYVDRARETGAVIYPSDPFRALRHISPDAVRVVILGQDPYHGPGQAQGFAFSVPDDSKRPPSLRNIFKELAREYPDTPAMTGNDLSGWADQGVLLLNTSLTVEDARAGSHARQGWEAVTDAVITRVAHAGPKVFMLWGAHAQAKAALLPPEAGHLVLASNHPSPLSATRPPVPFIGCGHFATANAWLQDNGQTPVQWVTSTMVLDTNQYLPL